MDIHSSPALQRIIAEDAVGQLRRRDGLMATLGSENGELKLDWVEGVGRLLADATRLEEVEAEARDIWQRGIRHIIWAGMGGSVLTVRVLTGLGFCSASSQDIAGPGSTEPIVIYPLDSTDPAALNAIVRQIARAKSQGDHKGPATLSPPYPITERLDQSFLHSLLGDVLMIGVSMGMTSEEPITHLAWFSALLEQAQLAATEHLLVMTLPGSYLDQFAKEHHAPSRPLQPDGGTGTGGRMSAPATRVFLLPAALAFIHQFHQPGRLRAILRRAWEMHNLDIATTQPAEHPFVRLAAAMSEASRNDVCRLLLRMPAGWDALVPWIEQLMEESLGKGGKGVVVFNDQTLHDAEMHGEEWNENRNKGDHEGPLPYNDRLRVFVATNTTPSVAEEHTFVLSQPYLAEADEGERLAAAAAGFLGWQLSMALFGYLHDITFAGQPAVENYKARARALRAQGDPLSAIEQWRARYAEGILTLFAPQGAVAAGDEAWRPQGSPLLYPDDTMAACFARTLREARAAQRLSYLDGTINGEASPALLALFGQYMRRIGNDRLGIPVKLRRAPADYHSTEQSEMDGPPSLVSLRLLARQHERCMVGVYDDTFLRAQAVSTWQAMLEQGRSCFLLVIDGYFEDAMEPLARFFESVVNQL